MPARFHSQGKALAYRRSVRLTLEGLIYVFVPGIVLTGAILREINILVLMGGLLTWPLIFSWTACWGAIRRIKVTRQLPPGVSAGDPLVVDIAATNGRRWGTSRVITIMDSVEREGRRRQEGRMSPSVLISQIRPGETVQASYRGQLAHRGRYRFGPLRVITEYPFGFVRGAVTLDQGDSLLVYPRLGRLTERWTRLHREEFIGSRRTRRQAGFLEGDYFGLREWRSGDSRRWIHWRTSARRGSLAVRQFEQPQHEDLAVLIDLWKPGGSDELDAPRIELAISFAATVVADLCGRGTSHILLGIGGKDRSVLQGPASKAFLADAMQRLALAQPTSDRQACNLLAEVLPAIGPGMRAVFVSTRKLERDEVRRAVRGDDLKSRNRLGDMIFADLSQNGLDAFYEESNATVALP
jgi:uncharacterized protein (DUF58 family)